MNVLLYLSMIKKEKMCIDLIQESVGFIQKIVIRLYVLLFNVQLRKYFILFNDALSETHSSDIVMVIRVERRKWFI